MDTTTGRGRTRLRPEYPCLTYAYACTLDSPIPQALWDTARAMQTLWNLLVAQHDALLAPWDAYTTRAVKSAAYTAFWQDAYRVVRDEGERLGLTVWPKWEVYDQFRRAQSRWTHGQAGRPIIHRGLQHILLPHRTTSGGVPIPWLWRDGPHKHTAILPPVPPHHHHEGYFTVGGERVGFRVLLHRPLPENAILKRVSLAGRFEPALRQPGDDGWRWKFLCSIEIPPRIPARPVGRSAGIDLGWRVRPEGLRVAVLSDGTKAWEWRIPWEMAGRELRRRQRHASARGRILETTGNWQRLRVWQSELDEALEACKTALGMMDRTAWPEEAKQLWQGHVMMRAGGLRRLASVLRTSGQPVDILEAWGEQHTLSRRRFRGAQLSLFAKREALYRLLADWLARHFDVISWEGNLDLKQLAEMPTDHPALAQARQYRQMAGLSQLRQYIREALDKRSRRLLETETAYTTQRCSVAECPGMIAPTAALEACCSEGHWEDQDVTAALNLWQAIPRPIRSTSRRAPNVDRPALLGRLGLLA